MSLVILIASAWGGFNPVRSVQPTRVAGRVLLAIDQLCLPLIH